MTATGLLLLTIGVLWVLFACDPRKRTFSDFVGVTIISVGCLLLYVGFLLTIWKFMV